MYEYKHCQNYTSLNIQRLKGLFWFMAVSNLPFIWQEVQLLPDSYTENEFNTNFRVGCVTTLDDSMLGAVQKYWLQPKPSGPGLNHREQRQVLIHWGGQHSYRLRHKVSTVNFSVLWTETFLTRSQWKVYTTKLNFLTLFSTSDILSDVLLLSKVRFSVKFEYFQWIGLKCTALWLAQRQIFCTFEADFLYIWGRFSVHLRPILAKLIDR